MTLPAINHDAKAWDQIEQQVQEFACRVVIQFVPSTQPSSWRKFLVDHHPSRHFGETVKTKRSLEEVEGQDLLRILAKLIHKTPPPSVSVSLQGKYDLPRSLPEMLDYVTSLRNKNDHAIRLSPQEQLADLILVQQVVLALECAEPWSGAATDGLKQLISQLITQYLDRAAGSGGIDSPQQEPEHELTELREMIRDLAGRVEEMGSKLSVALIPARVTSQDPGGVPDPHLHVATRSPVDGSTAKAVRERRGPYGSNALNGSEVRDQLIGLRWRIWRATGSGPSAEGLLKKRMIELLVANRVTDDAGFRRAIPARDRGKIDPRQLEYLPHVYEIIGSMA